MTFPQTLKKALSRAAEDITLGMQNQTEKIINRSMNVQSELWAC